MGRASHWETQVSSLGQLIFEMHTLNIFTLCFNNKRRDGNECKPSELLPPQKKLWMWTDSKNLSKGELKILGEVEGIFWICFTGLAKMLPGRPFTLLKLAAMNSNWGKRQLTKGKRKEELKPCFKRGPSWARGSESAGANAHPSILYICPGKNWKRQEIEEQWELKKKPEFCWLVYDLSMLIVQREKKKIRDANGS